jgi:hypothetical protein
MHRIGVLITSYESVSARSPRIEKEWTAIQRQSTSVRHLIVSETKSRLSHKSLKTDGKLRNYETNPHNYLPVICH